MRLARDGGRWPALVATVVGLRVPKKKRGGEFSD